MMASAIEVFVNMVMSPASIFAHTVSVCARILWERVHAVNQPDVPPVWRNGRC
jgi:hypothetical protein